MIPVLTSFAAGDLLPADDNTIDCGGDSGAKCFKAGDVRVNEHIGLVSERKYPHHPHHHPHPHHHHHGVLEQSQT